VQDHISKSYGLEHTLPAVNGAFLATKGRKLNCFILPYISFEFLLHNSFNKKRVRMPIPDAQREENIKQHKEYPGIEGIGKEVNISRKISQAYPHGISPKSAMLSY
jgi:hypothetical protein